MVAVSSDDTVESEAGSKAEERRKKQQKKKESEAAPPGYIQSLVNKIISNIQIVCNNLILKYVEDDLVLSLNVRTVQYSSCSETWTPAFTELSLPNLIKRKLLSVCDLTICLDRRGTTGKIEVYQDPLLYRCSMSVRLSWCYTALTSKTPLKTVINLLADKMDFSMTGLQVPMVVRLSKLFLAFYYGDMIPRHEIVERKKSKPSDECIIDMGADDDETDEQDQESLGSYLWDVGSSIGTALLPVYWEDEDTPAPDQPKTKIKLSSTLGFYIKEATLSLKLAANVKQKGFYRGGKQCFNTYLMFKLSGLFSEVITRGNTWVNVQAGVSQMLISPAGAETVPHYLMVGAESFKYLERSLFAPDHGTEEVTGSVDAETWDNHVETVTETVMLDRAPAMGLDYLYTVDLAADADSEQETDLEQSNLAERALVRLVLAPAQVHVTQGLVSRAGTIQELIRDYDYVPYVEPSAPPGRIRILLSTIII